MAKQMKFTATVKTVNSSIQKNSVVASSDGFEYTQQRQLTVCIIDKLANPSEFTPAQVKAINGVYIGLEVTGSKTLVGRAQAEEEADTGTLNMKEPAKVDDEVTLYLSRVPKEDGTGFFNFFEIGSDTGINNDALEELVGKNAILAKLFEEMETA